MVILLLPDGSKLFQDPIPEDFAWHCMFLALDRDIKLNMLKLLSCRSFIFLLFFCVVMIGGKGG